MCLERVATGFERLASTFVVDSRKWIEDNTSYIYHESQREFNRTPLPYFPSSNHLLCVRVRLRPRFSHKDYSDSPMLAPPKQLSEHINKKAILVFPKLSF